MRKVLIIAETEHAARNFANDQGFHSWIHVRRLEQLRGVNTYEHDVWSLPCSVRLPDGAAIHDKCNEDFERAQTSDLQREEKTDAD